MSWSLTIGRIAGVAVRVHVTFWLLLLWIGISAGRVGGAWAALESLVFIVLLFACVTAHEFGHILVARRFGISTREVTLLPIGGVASLQRMPDTPARELAVALAGPAVNVVIALLLAVALGSVGLTDMDKLANPGVSMLARLAAANLFLAVFNLIPAFPMDGGRVLHALLAMRMNEARATEIAAGIGQACAFALGFLGLFGNPILLFVAIFVYVAAGEEAGASRLKQALKGLTVADVMETRLVTLPLGATLKQALELALTTDQNDFPLVDAFAKPAALATRAALLGAVQTREPGEAAESVGRAPADTIRASASAQTAVEQLQTSEISALCVVDDAGALVGLLPRHALAETMLLRAAPASWSSPRQRSAV
jgi:Zn-dependent protease/CBS domain-containing protein